MPTQTTTGGQLDELLTLESVMAILKLGKTAARDALRLAGAPTPVVFNASCHRWWASEVYAWLRTLQAPRTTSHVLPSEARRALEPAPVRTSPVGRPRKHVV